MEFRQLGLTDLYVSTICLGTMQFGWTADHKHSFEIMDEALNLGCNFFDTADIYSSWHSGNKGGESESIIGKWLAIGSVNRDQLVIATKVRGKMGEASSDQGLSRQHIIKAVEDSLTRLQTDYIDLYQAHWPDDNIPIEETLRAFDDLHKQGKVRYIGCSNFSAQLLAESLETSEMNDFSRFDSLQPHYNFIHRAEFERELMPLCANQNIGVIPYSPLGGGFLTGKYRRDSNLPDSSRSGGVKKRYMNESGWQALENLEIIGNKYGATIAQTAIAWILANDTVSSAIIGANSLSQLQDTFAGSSVNLTAEDKAVLDATTAWQ
jgi:aryl-alcohol dehydrogenase-like predicted oxidoreductase